MPQSPLGPYVPEHSGFTHRVRCDRDWWERSRTVYWLVLDALWDHADRFILEDPRLELIAPIRRLPGIRESGDHEHILTGPTTPEARRLLIDPGREVWFSLTLKRGSQQLFYDEDGGDTMLFAAQPSTLERLIASGVTLEDLVDLGPAKRRAAVLGQIQAEMLKRLPGSWGHGQLNADPVRLSVSFPGGGGYRAVALVDADALERLAESGDPPGVAAALWADVGGLAEPTDGYRVIRDPSTASGVRLDQLPAELRPYRHLPRTHQLVLPSDPGLWERLIRLAADESDRLQLVIPPTGDPTNLLSMMVYGLVEQGPDPGWLKRVRSVALAAGPALDRLGQRFILPSAPEAVALLLEPWTPSTGWPLSFVRDGQFWLETARNGARLNLDATSGVASDPDLRPLLSGVARPGADRLLPPWF